MKTASRLATVTTTAARQRPVAAALLLALAAACGNGSGPAAPPDTGAATDLPAPREVVETLPEMPPPGEPVVLLQAGKSSHVVVLRDGASPSEQYAAEELRQHFEAATGVKLPIVTPAETANHPMIVLGRGPTAESLDVTPDDASLGEQGYVMRTVPPHLVIAGTAAAGTMYGVHRFLEEFLGVRWYAPGVMRIPAVENLSVPPLDRLVEPAFLWRHTSYEWPGMDDAFKARQGDNSGSGLADNKYGLEHSHDGRAHSYFWYVHPDEFFDEHPEYFSEIGGIRVRDETQLCLTNPDVLDIVTERMLERMKKKPHDRQHNFSQMDRYNYCQCDKCRAMNEKYGTTGGTQFWFVNELAKRTSQEYPDKLVGTLAYMYTEEPPKGLDMDPNVAVWLCHMYPSCDSHPVATCPNNADYKRRAEEWAKLAGHLYVWHYIVDFSHYYNPFPNFRAMSADMRFYRDIGVEGIYLQGMGHAGGGGEFSLLRPWYGMKLLWDPDQDPEALRTDFLEGYYGTAWMPIRDYIERLLDEVTGKDIHMHLYTNPAQGYLSDPVLEEADAFFDKAEAAVGADPELLERVKVARMPLTYARIFPRNGYQIADGKLKWLGKIASAEEVKEFLDRMEAHGFKTLREVGGDTQYLLLMYSMFASNLDVKAIDNGLLRVEVVPLLAGRGLRVIHKESGLCVTAHNVKPGLFFPFSGGLEDRIGGMFEAYGWVEPTTVKAHDGLSVTVAQSTVNGYALERTYTLEPDQPILNVQTVVTNNGGSPKEDHFRFHLELDLGDLPQTRVAFSTLAGKKVDKDMTGIIQGMREGEHFYDQEAPAGSWRFSGTKGLDLVQSFDNAQVDFTWLYAYPDTLGELEAEVWAPKLHLDPGQSATFAYSLAIQPAGGNR